MTDPARDDGPAERNNWNAILKWSLAQTDQDAGAEPAREISEADREWFVRAMESGMVDEIKRMKDITAALSANTAEVLDAEEIDARVELIEELNDRVCSIDNGGDLHTIGGLVPLVGTLASPHARRARGGGRDTRHHRAEPPKSASLRARKRRHGAPPSHGVRRRRRRPPRATPRPGSRRRRVARRRVPRQGAPGG